MNYSTPSNIATTVPTFMPNYGAPIQNYKSISLAKKLGINPHVDIHGNAHIMPGLDAFVRSISNVLSGISVYDKIFHVQSDERAYRFAQSYLESNGVNEDIRNLSSTMTLEMLAEIQSRPAEISSFASRFVKGFVPVYGTMSRLSETDNAQAKAMIQRYVDIETGEVDVAGLKNAVGYAGKQIIKGLSQRTNPNVNLTMGQVSSRLDRAEYALSHLSPAVFDIVLLTGASALGSYLAGELGIVANPLIGYAATKFALPIANEGATLANTNFFQKSDNSAVKITGDLLAGLASTALMTGMTGNFSYLLAFGAANAGLTVASSLADNSNHYTLRDAIRSAQILTNLGLVANAGSQVTKTFNDFYHFDAALLNLVYKAAELSAVQNLMALTLTGNAVALGYDQSTVGNVVKSSPTVEVVRNVQYLMASLSQKENVKAEPTATNSNSPAANPVYNDGIINLENYILVGTLGNLTSSDPTELNDAALKDSTGWWTATDSHVTFVPYIKVVDYESGTALVNATAIGTIDATATAGDPVHHLQNVNIGNDYTGKVLLLPTDPSGNVLNYVDANLLRLAMSDHKQIGVDIVWIDVVYNSVTYTLPYQVYEVSDLARLDNSGVANEKDFTIAWTQIPEAVLQSEFTNITNTNNAAYLIDRFSIAPAIGQYNDFLLRADRDIYGNMGPFTMRNGSLQETGWQNSNKNITFQQPVDAFSTVSAYLSGTNFRTDQAFYSTYSCDAVENGAKDFFDLTWRTIAGILEARAEPNQSGNSGVSDYHTRALVCDLPAEQKITIHIPIIGDFEIITDDLNPLDPPLTGTDGVVDLVGDDGSNSNPDSGTDQ